jgi:hypothetical protein
LPADEAQALVDWSGALVFEEEPAAA